MRQPLGERGARGTELSLAQIAGGDREPVMELEPLTVIDRRTTKIVTRGRQVRNRYDNLQPGLTFREIAA